MPQIGTTSQQMTCGTVLTRQVSRHCGIRQNATAVVGCCIVLGSLGGQAKAQQAVVQQPVVSMFGAAAGVSVPDRGSAFTAGVAGASAGTGSYGFMPNRSTGMATSTGAIETHVWIQDFAELDRQTYVAAEARFSSLPKTQRRRTAAEILRGANQSLGAAPGGGLQFRRGSLLQTGAARD